MIRVSIVIREIRYEQSVHGLFSLFCERYQSIESGNFGIRLLQKLGDDARPVLTEFLEGLSQERKNELLCALLQSFGPELIRALNHTLSRECPGVQAGGVTAFRETDGVRLICSGVAVDYGALLQNPFVQAKMSEVLPGPLGRVFGGRVTRMGAGEKTVLTILEQPKVREALLRFAGGVLEKKGVYLRLEDLRVEPDFPVNAAGGPAAGELRLSPELEEAILDSAAAYLRKRAHLS